MFLKFRHTEQSEVSLTKCIFLPLGGKVRMRGESEQSQQFPSPLGEGVGERVWYNQYLQEILRVDLFSSIQKSDLYTPQNDVACLFPLIGRGEGERV